MLKGEPLKEGQAFNISHKAGGWGGQSVFSENRQMWNM